MKSKTTTTTTAAAVKSSKNEVKIRNCLKDSFERLKASEFHPSPNESERYRIQDAFDDLDQYWLGNVWGERFIDSLKTGMLYRPAIVSELVKEVENVLQTDIGQGIFIKGPDGIGKSHSIVNLVRKLLYGSGGKYFVTFIPDCRFTIFTTQYASLLVQQGKN